LKIDKSNIANVTTKPLSEILEESDSYNIQILKDAHSFEIKLLKNCQYIFISLKHNSNNYPIEHIEFYNNETKLEVLNELKIQINKLEKQKSRITKKKKMLGEKLQVEILVDDKWKEYGYTFKQ